MGHLVGRKHGETTPGIHHDLYVLDLSKGGGVRAVGRFTSQVEGRGGHLGKGSYGRPSALG